MAKICIVNNCLGCPFHQMDPDWADAAFWGKPVCLHQEVGIREVHQKGAGIPDWCPLPDAAQ